MQKGKISPCRGKKASEETKEKQHIAWINRKKRGGDLGTKKPVIVMPINRQYDSLIEACKDLGLNYGSAVNVVSGRRNSIFGYKLKYVGGYINQNKEVI